MLLIYTRFEARKSPRTRRVAWSLQCTCMHALHSPLARIRGCTLTVACDPMVAEFRSAELERVPDWPRLRRPPGPGTGTAHSHSTVTAHSRSTATAHSHITATAHSHSTGTAHRHSTCTTLLQSTLRDIVYPGGSGSGPTPCSAEMPHPSTLVETVLPLLRRLMGSTVTPPVTHPTGVGAGSVLTPLELMLCCVCPFMSNDPSGGDQHDIATTIVIFDLCTQVPAANFGKELIFPRFGPFCTREMVLSQFSAPRAVRFYLAP